VPIHPSSPDAEGDPRRLLSPGHDASRWVFALRLAWGEDINGPFGADFASKEAERGQGP